MKTLQIVNVRTIPTKDGRVLFILDLVNGQPSIVRTAKEFIIDLQNSYLIGNDVQNPNHPVLLGILRDLKNFTVTGNVIHAKKDELWIVTENSRVVTDSTHPKHGSVVAGDKLPYEKDMSLVTEGFLAIALNPQIDMQIRQAQAYGTAVASTMASSNVFDAMPVASNVEEKEFDPSDIDADAFKEASEGQQPEE